MENKTAYRHKNKVVGNYTKLYTAMYEDWENDGYKFRAFWFDARNCKRISKI